MMFIGNNIIWSFMENPVGINFKIQSITKSGSMWTFFQGWGLGLMKTSKKLKKITIPVQIILCFSAKNINSKLIQVISLFQHRRILFHEIFFFSFLSIWYAVHILRGLYFCTYSALTSMTFHSLHPTKGVIQPFTFQLCVTT